MKTNTETEAPELPREYAEHQDPFSGYCEDCDHGIRGGKPCQSCDGTGVVTEKDTNENGT